MGKTKRNRTKYHFSSIQSDLSNTLSVESKLSVQDISEYSNEVSKNTAEIIENDSGKDKSMDLSELESDISKLRSNTLSVESKLSVQDISEYSNEVSKNTAEIIENDSGKDKSMDLSELESDISKLRSNTSEGWKVIPADDLFKNVDINIDKLETKVLIEDHKEDHDDRFPNNMSVSKLIKRFVAGSGKNIHLRKGEKRELRRNLFIKRIDAFHEGFFKKNPKKSKGIDTSEAGEKKSKLENSSVKTDLKASKLPKLPKSVNQLSDSNPGKISKRKQKVMTKLKSKREEMLNNIEFFNQIMSDLKYRSDPMGVITDTIQKQVYSDF